MSTPVKIFSAIRKTGQGILLMIYVLRVPRMRQHSRLGK